MDSDTMNQFDAVVGMQYLRGMHLNDSKGVFVGQWDPVATHEGASCERRLVASKMMKDHYDDL